MPRNIAQTNLEKVQSFIARLVGTAEEAEQIVKELDGTDWQALQDYHQERRGQLETSKAERQRLREEEWAKTKAHNLEIEKKKQARIVELQSMPYTEYLKTYEWRKRREYALSRAGHCCNICNKADTTLDVHHRTYERRGDENYNDLIVLCRGCHKTFHETGQLFKHKKSPSGQTKPPFKK